eukprot:7849150-Pyramimonas_sp.AAC.1
METPRSEDARSAPSRASEFTSRTSEFTSRASGFTSRISELHSGYGVTALHAGVAHVWGSTRTCDARKEFTLLKEKFTLLKEKG